MHVAMITAGGAGMFCGSCMHDNTWTRALMEHGAEVTLIPTYTPVRVDEQDLSRPHVFLGGINVYLDYRWRTWQRIPRRLTRWLDARWILNLAGKIGVSNDAAKLGDLTLALLNGDQGPQRNEVEELVDFLTRHLRPDVVCFSNALLAGVLPLLKQRYDGKVFCTLQGDDVFLEALPEPQRSRALEMVGERARQFDGFLVHSRYYRDFMADYLGLSLDRFHQVPLGIDLHGHDGTPEKPPRNPFTVGYFARICPEKGLHRLVEAFRILHRRHPETRLRAGGYLGKRDRTYFHNLVREAGDLGPAFEYAGSPVSHVEKVHLLNSFDVLSVPTVYCEPKGLPVLEALANGVPVVQPRHGAFPELLETTGGGLLVTPGDAEELADALERLLLDPAERTALAQAGYRGVRENYNLRTMAQQTLELFEASCNDVAVHADSHC